MDTRKDEIAEGFRRRFEHFGFRKTSVDDVAKDLKISKKTIYEHFDTKEEIFYYVVFRAATSIRRNMESDLAQYATNREKLDALVRMIFAQTRRWLKEGNDAFEFKYKYRIAELAFKDAYAELVTQLVEDGQKAGEFGSTSKDMMLHFIQGIMKESMDMVTANPDLPVEDEVIAAIFKLLA